MNTERPTWDEYFIEIAGVIAKRSTCLRVPEGVGCVITRANIIVGTGYAGSPRGQPHCIDRVHTPHSFARSDFSSTLCVLCGEAQNGIEHPIDNPMTEFIPSGPELGDRREAHRKKSTVGCLIDPVAGGCVRTIHAEQNAIIHARTDLRGATAYTTLSPCWICMRLLVQAGISRVVYRDEYRLGVEWQKTLAEATGVELVHMPLSES